MAVAYDDVEGTRFRLFAQPSFLEGFEEPEVVEVSPPAGTVGPGPSDRRMYVIDPVGKDQSYGLAPTPDGGGGLMPPWRGQVRPPVEPDEEGHFDYLTPGSHGFQAAHLYGTARRTLDVWEGYFGRRIDWHFAPRYDRLEMTLIPAVDNAFAGFGFLEAGAHRAKDGGLLPFSLNFDVIAHEVGHLIVYSELGVPTPETEQGEYSGFHESAADLVALLTVMHFDSVIDDLLARTSGNLYTYNKLNRFGELSPSDQIRNAGNKVKLSKFARGWRKEHKLSQPLTGAMFDILIDVFHELLVDRGLIAARVEELSDRLEKSPDYGDVIQPIFDQAFDDDPAGFEAALLDARDYLGTALAKAWGRLSAHYLDYADVGCALIEADREMTGGAFERLIRVNLRWRDIGRVTVGPWLGEPEEVDEDSHANSVRTEVPGNEPQPRPRAYRDRMALAGRRGVPVL